MCVVRMCCCDVLIDSDSVCQSSVLPGGRCDCDCDCNCGCIVIVIVIVIVVSCPVVSYL